MQSTWHPTRWLAIRIGGLSWLPRFGPRIVAVDKLLRRLTRGRVTLLTFAGLPELFLTVPGRKSGVPRTTPLLCVPDRGTWLVAGSNWGGPSMPQWVGNLRAAETAVVELKGRSTTVTAAELDGEERDEAWSAMLAAWPNYAKYEARTDRLIPVFRLAPA